MYKNIIGFLRRMKPREQRKYFLGFSFFGWVLVFGLGVNQYFYKVNNTKTVSLSSDLWIITNTLKPKYETNQPLKEQEWYHGYVSVSVRISEYFSNEKFCTKAQREQWLVQRAAGEIGWKPCTCSHGISLQTRSSSFYWYDKSIPEDLFLTPNIGLVHICVSAVPVFSLLNFLYPRGFNRAFPHLFLSIILA